jgi:hypothetical protein
MGWREVILRGELEASKTWKSFMGSKKKYSAVFFIFRLATCCKAAPGSNPSPRVNDHILNEFINVRETNTKKSCMQQLKKQRGSRTETLNRIHQKVLIRI